MPRVLTFVALAQCRSSLYVNVEPMDRSDQHENFLELTRLPLEQLIGQSVGTLINIQVSLETICAG